MKKLFVTMVVLVAAASAHAEWMKLGGNASASWYGDEATIKKIDARNMRTWNLSSFEGRRPMGDAMVGSVAADTIYDCQARTMKIMGGAMYDGPMATGAVIARMPPQAERPVAPDTPAWQFMTSACMSPEAWK